MSATIAGSLEIQLLANLARLQKDMNDAKGIVSNTMRDIERTVGKMKELLGGGFVAAGFVMVAKQAMEAEQAINRLNAVIVSTGNASGFTKDQLHGLADAMAEATQFDDEDIRGAIASFLKFGNVHGETLKRALKLTADYAAFTGTTMAAASETLGKAISSPAQGVERLQRAIGYLNPVQIESIKNMQEMGDTAGAQAALLAILEQKIGGVAETMNTGYTKAFSDAKKATGEFFETLGNSPVVTIPVQSFLKFAADSMRDMKAIIEDGDWVQAAKFLMGFRQTDEQAAARRPAASSVPDPAAQAAADLAAKKGFDQALADQDAKAIAHQTKERAKAREEWLKHEKSARDLDAKGWVAHIDAMTSEYEEGLRAQGKLIDEERRIRDAATNSLEEYVKQMEFENTLIGLSNTEREIAIRLRALEKAGVDTSAAAVADYVKRMREGLNAQEDFRLKQDEIGKQAKIWDDLATSAGNFFADLVMNGKSAFENLKKWLKDLLAQMIALFAKQWVLNIAGQGSLATSAGQGTVSGAANSLIGSGASLAGNYLATAAGFTGVGTWATFAGAASGAIPAAAIGAEAVAAGVGVNTFAASAGSYMTGIYTTLAAIPVWGWIAMAVIAIGAWIAGSHKGGPKTGGSWGGEFDAQGNLIGNPAVPGTDNGRFFTPTQMDPLFKELGTGMAKGYYETVKALGGTAGTTQFFAGGDMDPNGRSGARVSMQAFVNGRSVYNQRDIGIDQDTDQYRAELMLYGKRALLAAVQASDLPEGIAQILSTVVAETATSEQIDGILALAMAFGQLKKMMTGFTVEEVLAEASKTYGDRLTDQRNALLDLAGSTTMTTASLATLSTATATYQQNVASLIVAFQQAKDSMNLMFEDTFRNITLAGLDKQGKYDWYQQDAEAARALLATATDPEEIRMLTGRINTNINSAFNLLSPEEQRSRGAEFIAQGKQAQAEANARIEKLQKDAAADMKETLGKVNALLDKAASDFAKAGTDIKEGGANILTASQGTTTVRVTPGGGSGVITE